MFPKQIFKDQYTFHFAQFVAKLNEEKQTILIVFIDYILKGGFNNIEKYMPVHYIEFKG